MRDHFRRWMWILTAFLLLLTGPAAAFAEDPDIPDEYDLYESLGLDFEDGLDHRRHYPPYWPPVPTVPPSVPTNIGAPTSEIVPVTATVTNSEANFRASASTGSTRLAVLHAGEELLLLGQTTGTDHRVWYRAQYGTQTGYIRYNLVDVVCGTARFGAEITPVSTCLGQTSTNAVNVRLSMSTSSTRVRTLRRGQTVTVIGRAYDASGTPWYYVRIPTGAIGYILGNFLTVVSGTVIDAAPAQTVGSAWADETVGSLPADNAASAASAEAREAEELAYLKYLMAHTEGYSAEGHAYRDYTLHDLDGDGIREALVNCDADAGFYLRILTLENGAVLDLGAVSGSGRYLGREGEGLLTVHVLDDRHTQFRLMNKVADSLVQFYTIDREADDSWHYTWSYNQKSVTAETLLTLLSGFTDDVLQNMGLYGTRAPSAAPQSTPEPYADPAATVIPAPSDNGEYYGLTEEELEEIMTDDMVVNG